MKNQFHRLANEDPSLDRGLGGDLAATYHFKEAADYETGMEATISFEDASEAIRVAERFVAAIKAVLSPMTDSGKA